MVGSAKTIETETPFPDAIGFSGSGLPTGPPFFADMIDAVLKLLLLAPPCELFSSVGLDIPRSSKVVLDDALLESIVVGSADAVEREVLGGLPASGLVDLVELAAEDVAAEDDEENEEKTVPRTRLAFSRDASFLNFMRILEVFSGLGGGGRGLRSNGTNPGGRRVMCIECGRRCLGRQGGDGSLGVCDFSARTSLGV